MLNTLSKLPVNSTACESAEARVIGISSCPSESDHILVTTRSKSCCLGPLVDNSLMVASYAASNWSSVTFGGYTMNETISVGPLYSNGLPSGQFTPPSTESATCFSFTSAWYRRDACPLWSSSPVTAAANELDERGGGMRVT